MEDLRNSVRGYSGSIVVDENYVLTIPAAIPLDSACTVEQIKDYIMSERQIALPFFDANPVSTMVQLSPSSNA